MEIPAPNTLFPKALFLAVVALQSSAAFAQVAPGGDNMMNMQEIAQGLGVKCEYCHGGQRMSQPRVDQPRVDGQPPSKVEVARAMIAMTRDLNAKILLATGKPATQATRVTCITCHRGVAIPGQLSDIITKTALEKGPEAAVAQYRDLRNEYYGRQSYDFGEDTLLTSAQQLVRVKPEISIAVLRLNLEFYPKSVRSYIQIAFAYTRSLNDEAAITTLEKALEFEPDNGMVKGQLEQLKSYRRKRGHTRIESDTRAACYDQQTMVLEVEEARAQVERIFQSKTFRSSDVLRHLLSYLVDASLAGTADELKEYTVAVDALGKPSSYDPRQESAVRMQVGRLRQKLTEYYRTEGIDDPVIVDLPKGGFRVVFEPRKAAFDPITLPNPVIEEIQPAGWRRREVALAIGLIAALASTAFFAMQYWRAGQASSRSAGEAAVPWTPEIQQLWDPSIVVSRPLVVCIATPLSVLIPGYGFVREFAVNDWEDVPKSNGIAALKDALHANTVQPTFGYTGVGTASAALLLGQFLGARQKSLVMTRANLLSLPELMEENVVFLGPLTGEREIRALRVDQEILLEPDGIGNLHPRPGEPAFVPEGAGIQVGLPQNVAAKTAWIPTRSSAAFPDCAEKVKFSASPVIRFRALWRARRLSRIPRSRRCWFRKCANRMERFRAIFRLCSAFGRWTAFRPRSLTCSTAS